MCWKCFNCWKKKHINDILSIRCKHNSFATREVSLLLCHDTPLWTDNKIMRKCPHFRGQTQFTKVWKATHTTSSIEIGELSFKHLQLTQLKIISLTKYQNVTKYVRVTYKTTEQLRKVIIHLFCSQVLHSDINSKITNYHCNNYDINDKHVSSNIPVLFLQIFCLQGRFYFTVFTQYSKFKDYSIHYIWNSISNEMNLKFIKLFYHFGYTEQNWNINVDIP